jgi:hypothetical protein
MNTAMLRCIALNSPRSFHSSARALVKAGDAIPDLNVLVENSPGNKLSLAEEIKSKGGKALIIGVPAAFSKSPSLLPIILFEENIALLELLKIIGRV